MLTLYYGSGALGFRVGPVIMDDSEWNKLRSVAQRLLTARRWQRAADILSQYPFRICLGENDFNDSFSVLYARVTLPTYVELEEIHRSPGGREIFATIAKTITELSHLIRFVAAGLTVNDAPDPVANPSPGFATEVIERALADAEQLLSSSGPISAVDRVHTALHGYLQETCLRLNATTRSVSSLDIAALFKALRTSGIFSQSSHSQHAEKVAQGLANCVDALNPLRNQGSMAHPNKILLTDAEAMLDINAARTILSFVDASVAQSKRKAT